MRRATDKILGRTPANDVEKQQALLDEEAEKKRKRKRAAAGILGSLCTLLALALILTLVSIVWVSGITSFIYLPADRQNPLLTTLLAQFVISSYSFPMLTCRMHGYNSHCMFNAWDKSHGTSVDHWFKEHLHLSGDW